MNTVTEKLAGWRDNYLPQGGLGKIIVIVICLYLLGGGPTRYVLEY